MNRAEARQEFKNEIHDICREKFGELSDTIKDLRCFIERYKKICQRVDKKEGYSLRRIIELNSLVSYKDKLLSELNRFFFLKKSSEMPESNMRFTIEQFKEAHPMIETAKEYLELNYQNFAKCPFHNEKTNSFKIYKDHYYCYGCQETGDVIKFIMKICNKNFKEVLNI